MTHVALRGLAIATLGACALPAAAATSDRAETVIAAFREATGGSAWDRLDGCYEEGSHGDGRVAYRTWFSLQRYGMRVENRRDGVLARTTGYNGEVSWEAGPTGDVVVRRDEASLREAATTAYISSNLFFFPDRFPATFHYLREAVHGGRTYDIVEIIPRNGRALDYWFDRDTHLLNRVVDRQNAAAPMTFEAGDYRQSGEIRVAFRLSVIGPDGQIVDRGILTSLTCLAADAFLYDPPSAP